MARVQTDMAQVLHVYVVLTQAHPITQNISSYKLVKFSLVYWPNKEQGHAADD